MPSTSQSLAPWTVGELARLAGVSIRTLRHYDRLGLLPPSDYTEAGYRLYNPQALLQLQHILTLKSLGLSLEAIQQLLNAPQLDLREFVKRQKEAMQLRLQETQQVIELLEQAEATLESTQLPATELMLKVIEGVQNKQSQHWLSQFYSPEQWQALEARRQANPQEASAGTAAWQALFAEIRAQMQHPPASPQVQALLPEWEARWQALIAGFTQGNVGLSQSLQQLYSKIDQAPAAMQQWYAEWADIRRFLEQARQARDKPKANSKL